MVYTVLRRCKWLVLLVYSAADLPSPVEDEQNDDKVWGEKKKSNKLHAGFWLEHAERRHLIGEKC